MKNSIVVLSLILITSSCSENKEAAYQDTISDSGLEQIEAKAQLAATPGTDLYSNGKTRLIKTVNYRFEVANVKTSAEAIEAAVKKYAAYISSSNLRLENPILENKLTIRVRSEYFNELLKEIDLQARFVNYRDVKTDDIAKEFVDLESRLKTKREVEERYREILRKKAGTIEELLNAEQKIGDLHEDIEATISRINYLKDQESYSTINLEFYQTITQELTQVDKITWTDRFITALASGWKGILNISVALAYIWPLIVVAGFTAVFFKYWKKRKVSVKPV